MTARDRILKEARRLTLEHGVVPSLNTLAVAAGVSKGGLVHHFASRAALVDGLAREAIDEVDEALDGAAPTGRVAETWLRVSMPAALDADLFRALAVAFRGIGDDSLGTVASAAEAAERWEALIAAEVGDPALARIIRLVGDGLAMNAVAGIPVEVDPAALVARLRAAAPSAANAPNAANAATAPATPAIPAASVSTGAS